MRQECPERGEGNSSIFDNFIFLVNNFWKNSIVYKKIFKIFEKIVDSSRSFFGFGTLLLCVLTNDTNAKEMWNCANYSIKFVSFFLRRWIDLLPYLNFGSWPATDLQHRIKYVSIEVKDKNQFIDILVNIVLYD